MNLSTTEPNRYANLAIHAGPSPLGTWLKAALMRLMAPAPAKPRLRNRESEAAEVRAWADVVRRTDPRFADDLFAAADRHEAMVD